MWRPCVCLEGQVTLCPMWVGRLSARHRHWGFRPIRPPPTWSFHGHHIGKETRTCTLAFKAPAGRGTQGLCTCHWPRGIRVGGKYILVCVGRGAGAVGTMVPALSLMEGPTDQCPGSGSSAGAPVHSLPIHSLPQLPQGLPLHQALLGTQGPEVRRDRSHP